MNPFPAENATQETDAWYLTGQVSDKESVRKLVISGSPCLVGRRSDCQISLPHNSVSKNHAEFFFVDGQLCLRDFGSTNGTFVNGRRLDRDHAIVGEGDLIQFATLVFRLGYGRQVTEIRTLHDDACDRALAMMQFDRLMNDGGMVPFIQPIVDIQQVETVGFEVLARSRLFGLKTPAEMFSAAAKLNLEAELSREMRLHGVQLCDQLLPNMVIFVNTHPIELTKPGLFESLTLLRESAPHLPIAIEIHEAAITDSGSIAEIRRQLNDLNMQLAFDDFGAGRARLVELSEVRPDYVKFDMNLTREIHRAPQKRQEVVALIAKMVNDLGIISLAEGVEHEESHIILKEMNFQLGQGYYYGRPASVETYAETPSLRAPSDTDRSREFHFDAGVPDVDGPDDGE
jgi:EAL domain-containing protein (putative c-di-GMP-specific phosphodiesterase class I)